MAVAVSSLLGALIPGANRHLLADAPPGAGLRQRASRFPQRPAYLVIFPSWLAYLFWNKGIATIGARGRNLHPHHPSPAGVEHPLPAYSTAGRHLFSALFIMVGIGICSLEKRRGVYSSA